LGDNKLESLPKSIGNLKNLKVLNLSRNQLSSLPVSIFHLSNLEEIYLSENNFNIETKDVKELEIMGIKVFL
jgi:Leucine-rich repeat (LRR) protein